MKDNVLFTATGSNMTMEVTADKMTQHASSLGGIEAAKADAEAIDVSLTVGTTNPIMCKYNIYFQWNSSSAAYLTKTSGATKEFTAQLAMAGNGSSGYNKLVSETQLTDVVTTTNKTLVVEGASIVASSSSSGSQTWSPTIRFYNLQLDQTNLAGKTFSGKFTIDGVECGGVNTLSENIIAKVSEEDYTSSQDSSIYKVARETASSVDPNAEYAKLSQSEYGATEYKGTSTTTLTAAGTTTSGMFDYNASDNTYSNDTTNMAASSYYHLVIPVTENGYYQICYKVNSSASSNYLYAYVTDSGNSASGTSKLSKGLTTTSSTYTCSSLGHLTNANAVRVVNRTYTSKASVTFYLQRTNQAVSADAGIRYEGLDPDNYLTFNGESAGWRIIGVFEGSTIGLEPGKYYTKIIRNTRIGSYAWDSGGENDWTNSTLNTYLNGTYLSSMIDSSKIAKYNGNYSTWYLRGGGISYSQKMYIIERISGQAGCRDGTYYGADTETTGAIGIMYPSDYGYAAYGTTCKNNSSMTLYEYEGGCAAVDWLATDSINNADYEWLISPSTEISREAYRVRGIAGGDVWSYDGVGEVSYAYAVRPTLYLETNITTTGSGTKIDPYVLN